MISILIILIVRCFCKIEYFSNSQFGQDDWVLDYFNNKRNGTYLEIGVHDGIKNSNTVKLDRDFGWTGICVDPFMKNMEKRTCKQFHVALGSEDKEVNFVMADGLSGAEEYSLSAEHNGLYADSLKDKSQKKVQMLRVDDILSHSGLPSIIDYMSLDVEGSEMDILKSFPFDKYCVRYSTIETNNDKAKEKEMTEFMKGKGYTFLKHEEVDHVFINPCD